MIKKIISMLFVAMTMVTLMSCDSDDDLPSSPSITVNSFCFGDQTSNFDVIGAFRGETEQLNPTEIRTVVNILGDGLSLNDVDELEGIGVLMQLNFYGNSPAGFQTGVYDISNLQESANVSLSYALDYDATNTFNSFIEVSSGFIRVETFRTGFAITVDGIDGNGDEFHGIYLGDVLLIP